jgi:hypothetical protein
MYVQRLLSTIQDQQEQMNKIDGSRPFPLVHQVSSPWHFNNVITITMLLECPEDEAMPVTGCGGP